MPSPVGHTLGAFAAILAIEPSIAASRYKTGIALGTSFVVGSLADIDFVVAYFTTAPYLRHHYFTHSIPFAIAFGLACWVILKLIKFQKASRAATILCVAYGSHLLLDYFAEDGSKPYGIPLLWPITDRHFIAPFDLFFSIHRGEFSDIFSQHNLVALLIETAILGPIALVMYLLAKRRIEGKRLRS